MLLKIADGTKILIGKIFEVKAFRVLVFAFLFLLSGGAEAGNLGEDLVKADLALITLRYSSSIYSSLDYLEEASADKANQKNYRDDHESSGTAWQLRRDIADEAARLYKTLSDADALSFADALNRDKFDKQNPGYRTETKGNLPAGGDFAAEYKKRADEWQKYALGVLEGNYGESRLENAVNVPSRPFVNAQLHMSRLNDASLGADHYFKLLQTGNYSLNFMNQGVVLLRTDAQRELEAQTRYALDEMQEEADGEAAFEMGIRKWKNQSAGENY